jgi:hypothetical protein
VTKQKPRIPMNLMQLAPMKLPWMARKATILWSAVPTHWNESAPDTRGPPGPSRTIGVQRTRSVPPEGALVQT